MPRRVSQCCDHPCRDLAARLEREVRHRWQPQVRARAKQKAVSADGPDFATRARFGFTAAPGATGDARIRDVTQPRPPAAALLGHQEPGAGLDVEFTAID
ncbi:telomere-protecting terminal protein Tpg [Streptomyces sp. NPDC059680]|uniref:telomere-protecting terminal protein Tpg n=1 Tax=Streptomyces sp. NPDC059680 TaxID=3346904 RepID=UPI0036B17F07